MRLMDWVGQRIPGTRLTVIKRIPGLFDGRVHWLCHCRCGNIKVVPTYRLRCGYTKSCGCLRNELGKKQLAKLRREQRKKSCSTS